MVMGYKINIYPDNQSSAKKRGSAPWQYNQNENNMNSEVLAIKNTIIIFLLVFASGL